MSMLTKCGFRVKRDRVIAIKELHAESDAPIGAIKSLAAFGNVEIAGDLTIVAGTIQKALTSYNSFSLVIPDIAVDVSKNFYLVMPTLCIIVSASYAIVGEGAGHTLGCTVQFRAKGWGFCDGILTIPAPGNGELLSGSVIFTNYPPLVNRVFHMAGAGSVKIIYVYGGGTGAGKFDLTLNCEC